MKQTPTSHNIFGLELICSDIFTPGLNLVIREADTRVGSTEQLLRDDNIRLSRKRELQSELKFIELQERVSVVKRARRYEYGFRIKYGRWSWQVREDYIARLRRLHVPKSDSDTLVRGVRVVNYRRTHDFPQDPEEALDMRNPFPSDYPIIMSQFCRDSFNIKDADWFNVKLKEEELDAFTMLNYIFEGCSKRNHDIFCSAVIHTTKEAVVLREWDEKSYDKSYPVCRKQCMNGCAGLLLLREKESQDQPSNQKKRKVGDDAEDAEPLN